MYFLFLRMFELLEHSKYMIIYKIRNFWNFDSFKNCQILKICQFSKLRISEIWLFYEFFDLGNFH